MPETITDAAKAAHLGTPDIPAGTSVFTIYASTRISAPAALVFRTLRNTDTWRDWNKFCPRVNLVSQPPEAEDEATLAEIQQLVRNTSVAGSVDSAITDGAASQGTGLIGRRMSVEEEDRIRGSPPPVTKVSLRRQSLVSQGSGTRGSGDVGRSASVASGDDTASAMAALAVANVNAGSGLGLGVNGDGVGHARKSSEHGPTTAIQTNGDGTGQRLSAAQKYQTIQDARKASILSGEQPDEPKNVLVEAPHDPNLLVTAPNTPAGQQASKTQKKKSVSAATKKRLSINALYGEPSVRIQMGTKMILHLRMKLLKDSLGTDREMSVVVTEVSRPEDNEELGIGGIAAALGNGEMDDDMQNVRRMQTHLEAKQPGVYRIVWNMLEKYNPPKSYPKWMLQAQRVHEIRKVVRGDGKEECVYEDWECWKGMMAKRTEKKYKSYWNERAKEWGLGLGSYCEAMGGDVERRDFVG
ncbi:uncharacterized protein HMPREF1541_09274 [Cyphellophora europaea CBS 101466]|uniref:Uncharacterized protein n=1 Tax=Cyphellophora europaea (strain CBS 101466) TaxID=1220924 RepID=W2SBQ9_CYPE1|nr:uncharacterized protein HMPREF1541_09274 [Cyphellophora europaea CBS 101466]ETN45443.1 hypothetical protein HMPREF1541_09274 [Cyphellophora europaea CBS 101466]